MCFLTITETTCCDHPWKEGFSQVKSAQTSGTGTKYGLTKILTRAFNLIKIRGIIEAENKKVCHGKLLQGTVLNQLPVIITAKLQLHWLSVKNKLDFFGVLGAS
jgi:hypothetical protein